MPFIEVTMGPMAQARKRELVRNLYAVFATPDGHEVTVVFRHIDLDDYVRNGQFVFGSDRPESEYSQGPAIANITIGALDEAEKRRIAVGVAHALAAAKVSEEHIQIHFRHVTGRDVALAGGEFPFRPEGSTW